MPQEKDSRTAAHRGPLLGGVYTLRTAAAAKRNGRSRMHTETRASDAEVRSRDGRACRRTDTGRERGAGTRSTRKEGNTPDRAKPEPQRSGGWVTNFGVDPRRAWTLGLSQNGGRCATCVSNSVQDNMLLSDLEYA